jgi:CHAT domain-containing protein
MSHKVWTRRFSFILSPERWEAPYYWAAFTLQGEWQ